LQFVPEGLFLAGELEVCSDNGPHALASLSLGPQVPAPHLHILYCCMEDT
jgi:hypothetical protein